MEQLALVTGAGRGIGAAIAERLQADGHRVVAVDRSTESLELLAARSGIPGVKLDVSDFDAVADTVPLIESTHGPIAILVNNAGITRDALVHKMSRLQWSEVIEVNLGSVFNMCRAIVPKMRERGSGRIINISSMNAQRGQFGQANYCAAKAGIIGFTKAIAQELAPKQVTANCITPGFIETEMTSAMPAEVLERERKNIPIGRLGQPTDIATMVSFLAGSQATFVTGATFSVNGGQHMV